MERRDFINNWGRLLLLGGMAGVAGYLAGSGKISGDSSCNYPKGCKKCPKSASCKEIKHLESNHYGQ